MTAGDNYPTCGAARTSAASDTPSKAQVHRGSPVHSNIRATKKETRFATLEFFDFSTDTNSLNSDGSRSQLDFIWITWERQRRTLELSKNLGIRLIRIIYRGPKALRYPWCAFFTINVIKNYRPKLLFVQNPSLVLTLWVSILKLVFGFSLVVDRHTNFLINKPPSFYKFLFSIISDFTLRRAELTVVTNRALAELVEKKHGSPFVLPDPLPEMPEVEPYPLAGRVNICFICTYSGDEPFEEVISAGEHLPKSIGLYITGNPGSRTLSPRAMNIVKENPHIILTGFLSEDHYFDLLGAVDVVMDLTTLDHCLVCGAYEGIAAGKPLILSRKSCNSELFGDTPIYVEATKNSILDGIKTAIEELHRRTDMTRVLGRQYRQNWQDQFEQLRDRVLALGESPEG